jgi:von Willebrand factor A domain-containing protein 7
VRRCRSIVHLLVMATVGAATVSAFDVPTHRAITLDKLKDLTATVGGKTVKFSQRALEEVAQANEDTDDLSSAALFHPERHFTNERFLQGTTELMTQRQRVISSVTGSPADGSTARKALGRALHAIQDFYSHSNWIEQGKGSPIGSFGTGTTPNPPLTLAACPVDGNHLGPNGGGGDTSGYYVGLLGCGSIPAGKCWHGNYTSSCPGINKDKSTFTGHGAARAVAEQATTNFVQGILDTLAGNDKALMALLDVRGTTAFIIDDTGSMGGTIDGVKSIVGTIVTTLNSDPDLTPTNWLLERFNDPDFGPPLVTDSASTLLGGVNALFAHGGGDCPELSQSGLLEAIDGALPNSTLYLFTDASALDGGLVNAVIAKARDKDIVLNYALSGSCSPIDPAYVRGANETGGFLIPLANRSAAEVIKLTNLFLAQLSGDLVRVASSKGTLASVTSLPFPIDGTARRLVVLANADSLTDFKLRRPSGAVVAAGDPDAQITTILGGRIVIVTAPATGSWTVELTGAGAYAIAVNANSPLEFRRFAIVRPNADIHGGYFPISGQPFAGSTVTGDATVLGPFASATFTAVDDSGTPIKSISLVQNFPDAAADHFLGTFLLPGVPFRMVAEGQDQSGHPFRREFPALFTGQPASVQVGVGATDTLLAGTIRSFGVTVTNAGGAATYGLQATSSVPAIGASVSPGSVAVPGGGTATSSLSVTVPAGTPEGTEVAVTVTATNAADSSIFNSATVRFVVASNRPPDTSAAAPTIAMLWPVNHDMVEVGIAGVTDPDGDPVTVLITGISQSEPVNAPGDGNTCPDGTGEGTATALLRAERSGGGTGRFYVIEFTADDGKGGITPGTVLVQVPKSMSEPAVDGGLRFASGACR